MLPGFRVLLEKELREALRQKRIIIFAVIMTGLIALVPIVSSFSVDTFNDDGGRRLISSGSMDSILGTWAGMVGYLGALMVIAATVDAITGERSLGITAWIVTKPVARQSYLLAKIAAHAIVAVTAIVLTPTLIFTTFMLLFFQNVPLDRILAATAVLTVEMVFLSTVVVALGVLFRSVMPILLVSLALWFAPVIVPAINNLDWTIYVLPSYLPVAAIVAAVSDQSDIAGAALTVPLASAAIALLALATAITLFEKQEL